MAERLDAFLAHAGLGSRSEVRGLIRAGRVRIGGAVVRDGARHVDAPVTVDGAAVRAPIGEATLILHKPAGVACSRDPREAPLLDSIYPPELAHLPLEPAGRLDRATTGLLIASTDGQLIHSLTNPRRHVIKRYRVVYAGALSARAVERVERGLMLPEDERPTLPALLVLDAPGRATIHLREGRFHQVRRMFAALGGEVVGLHRDRIGALDLPADLPPGGSRALDAGGRAALFAEPEDIAAAWRALPPALPGVVPA